MRQDTADLHRLFVTDTPLMDVRSPSEFNRGAFPQAQNLPLLDDAQRHIIGIEYRRKGQQAAIQLGWELGTKAVVAERVEYWLHYIQRHPEGYLYCFRGGLRSHTSQQILRDATIHYPLVEGGYKGMRTYLLEQLAHNCAQLPLIVIAGHSGSGKTELIQRCPRALDLEQRARHRGSSFGHSGEPQPTQINFENQISIDLLKLAQQSAAVFVEDESHLIGRCALPLPLQRAMKAAPQVMLDEPLEARARRIVKDYVCAALPRFAADSDPQQALGAQLQNGLSKLQKRLGSLRYQKLDQQLRQANLELQRNGNSEAYLPLVMTLLKNYYDKAYHHLMRQRQTNILFRGNYQEVAEWINTRNAHVVYKAPQPK